MAAGRLWNVYRVLGGAGAFSRCSSRTGDSGFRERLTPAAPPAVRLEQRQRYPMRSVCSSAGNMDDPPRVLITGGLGQLGRGLAEAMR